jgi:hypothetical protein
MILVDFMKDIGRMIRDMETDLKCFRIRMLIMESMLREKPPEREFIPGEMEKAIRDNLPRVWRKVMEFGKGLKGIHLLELGKIIRLKAMECIPG